ncbi:acyltransferase family protein [Hirschia litorea]|uniref:Acyltransferase family protein n=1 Tax=Hirschia litorea TaxID=1199156 RepID=A0ABW2IKU9_9PROT
MARLSWLDGMRAYAILGVIFVHAVFGLNFQPPEVLEYAGRYGVYGVQLFFVISSIAIYMTLAKQRRDASPISDWYGKRIFRIAPLYFLGIIVFVSLKTAFNVEQFQLYQILANITFVHAFVPSANNNVVPGGWSIGVEMAFYLIAPMLFMLLTTKKWWAWLWSAIGVALLGVTWFVAGGLEGYVENNSYLYFWPFTQIPVFLIAMAMMKWGDGWILTSAPTPKHVFYVALLGLGIFFLAGTVAGPLAKSHMMAPTLFGVAFCCLVLLARDQWKALFSAPFVVHIGRLSYSMYLVHFFVMFTFKDVFHIVDLANFVPEKVRFFVFFPVILLFTYGLSRITYKWIELPGMQLGVMLIDKAKRAELSIKV